MQTSSRGNARLNEYHPAFEEYCEAIFELHEDDVAVIQARIAERLDVSRPAVSEMVHKMADEGLLTVNRGKIALSVEGMKLAEQVVRRHRLAERFLTDVLGLSWALAHQEAGKWEHVISTPVEDAMAKLLGDPTTCPHGNPIPGSDYRPRPGRPVGAGSRRRLHDHPHPRGVGVCQGHARVSRKSRAAARSGRHAGGALPRRVGHRFDRRRHGGHRIVRLRAHHGEGRLS